MTQGDPTDHALATIASILERPEATVLHQDPASPAVEERPLAPEQPEADGYCKFGPGPMTAIRFKWAVRRAENGLYYVDETIGENSTAMVTGPMTGREAVKLVDDRESEARARFEQLKSEMAGRAAAADLVRNNSAKA